MAYSTVPKSTSYFNTKLYTGNATGRTISGVGFQPDWSWIKNRSDTSGHRLLDAVRGATKELISNANNAEATEAQSLQSWNSDGFVLGTAAGVNANTNNFVSWNWKANGSGSANGDGTINSTVSVDTASGFSIVKYTGYGSASTVGHGLGTAPTLLINKALGTQDWFIGISANSGSDSISFAQFLKLNDTANASTNSGIWNDTAPSSSVFTINSGNGNTNASGVDYITYCFTEKTGFSKFGMYQGNSSSNGPFIYTGFRPAFVMIKQATGGNANEVWRMMDGTINPTNTVQKFLVANNSSAEATSSSNTISMFSNGFKINTGGENSMNTNYGYIYMAFGQPIVSTNGDIATAR